MRALRLVIGLTLLAGLAALALASMPSQLPRLSGRAGPPLTAAKIWGYQLQGARAELIDPDIDLVVIDHARESSATQLLTAADVAAFRKRDGRPPRIVLAYMSVGEAERYRYYWRASWTSKGLLSKRPDWLAQENKDWKGNYLVRFWEPDWQKIICNPSPSLLDGVARTLWHAPMPYIDQLIDAGFDGVYLDRVDVFGEWEKTRPSAEADMAAFVGQLSAYAKQRKPGFLIVPQNGEELAAKRDYRQAIDGVAKEDLLFGVDAAEKPNNRDETKRSVELLRKVKSDGKPVFVVEYLRDQNKRTMARARMAELGFTVTFAERDLNRPPELTQPANVSPVMSPNAKPATAKPQL